MLSDTPATEAAFRDLFTAVTEALTVPRPSLALHDMDAHDLIRERASAVRAVLAVLAGQALDRTSVASSVMVLRDLTAQATVTYDPEVPARAVPVPPVHECGPGGCYTCGGHADSAGIWHPAAVTA